MRGRRDALRAYSFYLQRSAVNGIRRWLQRLKRPQYGGLMAVAMVWLILTRTSLLSATDGPLEGLSPATLSGLQIGGAWGLGLLISARWLLGLRGVHRGVERAQAPFWLSAPVSTFALIALRWAKAQPGILLMSGGLLIYGVVAERPLLGLPLALTGWLLGTTLTLHESVCLLVLGRLQQRWLAALTRILLTVLPLALLLAAVRPLPPLGFEIDLWLGWIEAARAEGLAAEIMAPVLAFGRLPFAETWAQALSSAGLAAILPLALGIVSWAASGLHLGELAMSRQDPSRERRSGPPRWALAITPPLAAAGARWRAVCWMILTPVLRRDLPALAGMLGAIVLGMAPALIWEGPVVIKLQRLMALALFMSMMVMPFTAPALLRADLRVVLARVDLIRALPVTGASLVRASIYAPTLIMILIEITLAVSIYALAHLGMMGPRGDRAALVFDLLPLLSAVALLAFTAQNAVVMMFPRWFITPGAQGGVGASAMSADGGTALAGVAYGVVFALLALTPALLAGGAWLLQAALGGGGWVSWAFCGGAIIVTEGCLRLLGRHLDHDFDPTAP